MQRLHVMSCRFIFYVLRNATIRFVAQKYFLTLSKFSQSPTSVEWKSCKTFKVPNSNITKVQIYEERFYNYKVQEKSSIDVHNYYFIYWR